MLDSPRPMRPRKRGRRVVLLEAAPEDLAGGNSYDDNGRVLRPDHTAVPGLFVAGEALGGLFCGNYPGGTGLTAGIVFGRRAGSVA